MITRVFYPETDFERTFRLDIVRKYEYNNILFYVPLFFFLKYNPFENKLGWLAGSLFFSSKQRVLSKWQLF